MFGSKKDDTADNSPKKKKEGKLSKILLGVVIGGAVGSVLGVTLSDEKNRDYIKRKSRETWEKSQIILGEIVGKKEEKKKETLWHKLHKILTKKDHDED